VNLIPNCSLTKPEKKDKRFRVFFFVYCFLDLDLDSVFLLDCLKNLIDLSPVLNCESTEELEEEI